MKGKIALAMLSLALLPSLAFACSLAGQECASDSDCCQDPGQELFCTGGVCIPPPDTNLVPEIADSNPDGHYAGYPMQIALRIRNIGRDAAGPSQAEVSWLRLRAVHIDVPALGSGESRTLALEEPLSCPGAGTYPLALTADSGGAVREPQGESDNALTLDIECRADTPAAQNWIRIAAIGLIAGLSIIALMFMASRILGRPELGASAAAEFYQLLMTGAVVASFALLQIALESVYLPSLQQALIGGPPPPGTTLIGNAQTVTYSYAGEVEGLLGAVGDGMVAVGREGSKSTYCSFLGAGYNIVTCSTLNAARAPLGMAFNSLALAYADLTAQSALLSSGMFLFSLLLPLGIVLRVFRLTRHAGGALVAIAIGFYFVFPSSILFMHYYVIEEVRPLLIGPIGDFQPPVCNPMVMDERDSVGYLERLNSLGTPTSPGIIRPLLFITLIQSIFATILSVFITLAFIRYIAQILGAEIDVSMLSRIT